jgi:phage terminase large subunit-like protein
MDKQMVQHMLTNSPERAAGWKRGCASAKRDGWLDKIRTVHDVYAVADGCVYDDVEAKKPGRFTRNCLEIYRGPHAGKPFELLPWLADGFIEPLFGWRRPDGTRRFRKARLWVPKKNAKSMTCAALVLYLLSPIDGEHGPCVYTAAVTRDQARQVFEPALKLAKNSPKLMRLFTTHDHINRINCEANNGFAKALSADGASNEGHDASAIIYDELHVWRDRLFWDSLKYAGAARSQPLHISISTAGDDVESIGYGEYELSVLHRDALATGFIDWEQLNLIFECPPELVSKWNTPEAWYAANPSLGVTIKESEMAAMVREAEHDIAVKSRFLRYRLNVWVQAANPAFDMKQWHACGRRELSEALA